MLQIQDKLVSLDLVEKFFTCDLGACKGECCIDGDAGAPITEDEAATLKEMVPHVLDMLTPAARKTIEEEGVCYVDQEGDLVTQIVNGRDCVFTTYAPGGMCLCALEKASREGKIPPCKPLSCSLYPVRVKHYGAFTAVNYHKWKICHAAEKCGARNGVRVYQFLREPLIRAFGRGWYDELDLTAQEYLKQHPEL